MFTDPEDIPLDGGGLRYYPQYIADSEQLYEQLRDSVAWQQPILDVYGKRHPTPRLVAFVGDPGIAYRYSGHRHCAGPWPSQVRLLSEKIAVDTGFEFNCALLNYYRNGEDSMGYHSDDEVSLGSAPCIASVSLGCGRDFLLKPKGPNSKSFKMFLAPGSLLLMLPPTQRNWQHALPARKGLGQGRINITFRKVVLSLQD